MTPSPLQALQQKNDIMKTIDVNFFLDPSPISPYLGTYFMNTLFFQKEHQDVLTFHKDVPGVVDSPLHSLNNGYSKMYLDSNKDLPLFSILKSYVIFSVITMAVSAREIVEETSSDWKWVYI